MVCKYAECSGCRARVYSGPYFIRRIVRHLKLRFHSHDVMTIVTGGRKKNRGLRGIKKV